MSNFLKTPSVEQLSHRKENLSSETEGMASYVTRSVVWRFQSLHLCFQSVWNAIVAPTMAEFKGKGNMS